MKPLWYGGWWSKYKYGEAWQIDYITLPQTCQGKRYVLTMVETTIGWLETYPVPHATAQNTILGLGKQVLWRHQENRVGQWDSFHNSLKNIWAREHGIEWIYPLSYTSCQEKLNDAMDYLRLPRKHLWGRPSKIGK